MMCVMSSRCVMYIVGRLWIFRCGLIGCWCCMWMCVGILLISLWICGVIMGCCVRLVCVSVSWLIFCVIWWWCVWCGCRCVMICLCGLSCLC